MPNIFSSGVNICLFFIQVRFPDGIIFFLFVVYFFGYTASLSLHGLFPSCDEQLELLPSCGGQASHGWGHSGNQGVPSCIQGV